VETMSAGRLAALLGTFAEERPPLYAALATRLRQLVGDGRLPVGVRLPAERHLASALGLSRATVTAAYRRLREDGWAAARQGSGTWTRLPAGPATGAWVPAPAEAGVLDLVHAAPPAPPEVSTAFARALEDLPRLLPTHGYYPLGLPELRARIADRYAARGLPTIPEQVLVTSGALHGLAVTLAALTSPGDRVLVEHPSYPNALDAVSAARTRPVPVAVDADDPESVPADMLAAARQTRPRLAYVMPDFQNPTGALLDVEQRSRLAAGLAQTGTVAVVDETLAEIALDVDPLPPYAAVAAAGTTVTVGTMSKAFWGGLRIGWLRADADVVRRLAATAARSHLSGPVLEQLAACHLLDAADVVLPGHLARLREQRDGLVSLLARRLPRWHVRTPAGGLVLWCRLAGLSSSAVVSAADRRGLRLAPGPRFSTGHAFDDRLRLPYTQPVDALRGAVDLLADVLADLDDREPALAVRPDVVV
jgi:DNA-binding transcriptional MocR family regulator